MTLLLPTIHIKKHIQNANVTLTLPGRRSSLAQLTEILKDWSIRDKPILGRDKKEKLNQGNKYNCKISSHYNYVFY